MSTPQHNARRSRRSLFADFEGRTTFLTVSRRLRKSSLTAPHWRTSARAGRDGSKNLCTPQGAYRHSWRHADVATEQGALPKQSSDRRWQGGDGEKLPLEYVNAPAIQQTFLTDEHAARRARPMHARALGRYRGVHPEELRSHHIATVRRLLETLSKHRVALKRPKCEIVVWRTGWLGFKIHRRCQDQDRQAAQVTELTQSLALRSVRQVRVQVRVRVRVSSFLGKLVFMRSLLLARPRGDRSRHPAA